MRASYKGIPINTSKNTHEEVFRLINQPKDGKIIDIPSGNGAFVLRLKDHGFTNVWAVDIRNIMTFPHENFVLGDMTKGFNLPSSDLETVVCIDGIEHIREQDALVKEAHRVLKPGGHLVLSTPNISSLRSRWKWLVTGHHHKCDSPLDEKNPNPLHHVAMISFPELRYLLHTNGFKITEIRTNQCKFASWLYLPLVPLVYLMTSLVYRKTGRRDKTTEINNEVKSAMFSKAVLFGETIILKALKT
jgi:2-polyprenyl-3-methyl-5-hydroxy-6-metoxy-1,4-benzoquinol methylase